MSARLLVALVAVCIAPQCLANDVEALITGAIDRSNAITSGRLEWTYHSGRQYGPYEFVFSDDRWRMRAIPPAGRVTAAYFSDGAIYVEMLLSGQSENLRIDRYRLTKMAPGTSWENYLPGTNYKPPLYAGSIPPHLLPKELYGRDWRLFQWLESTNINGVATRVCDGPQGQTKVRLFIAPELGYAVPAIQHVNAQGQIASRQDAFDFKEVAPSIFFPGRITLDAARQNQAILDPSDCIHIESTIKLDQINNIPVEQIEVEIPAGSLVDDATGSVVVRLERPASPSEAWQRLKEQALELRRKLKE